MPRGVLPVAAEHGVGAALHEIHDALSDEPSDVVGVGHHDRGDPLPIARAVDRVGRAQRAGGLVVWSLARRHTRVADGD